MFFDLLKETNKMTMKKIFFSMLLLASSAAVFAQNDRRDRDHQAPQPIQRSFQKDYPDMTVTNWQRQNSNQWHGIYKDKNNRDIDVYYDGKGKRLSSHQPWDRKDVPQVLDRRINTRYHTRDYQVFRIERPNYKPLFQIKLEIGGKNRVVYMDERGNERKYAYRY
jgi:hypothetical protein